jgi:hypothetical protein
MHTSLSLYFALLLFLAAAAIILILLLMKQKKYYTEQTETEIHSAAGKSLKPCPLCGTLLEKGMNVKSVVYPGKTDRLTEIFGCPHCWPDNEKHIRLCPVCKNTVPPGEPVAGRFFESPGKKHLHVLGCPKCRKRNR